MSITIETEDILRAFSGSFRIPCGIFDAKGNLTELHFDFGTRIMGLYLRDAAEVLARHGSSTPVLAYDKSGSCWCVIPYSGRTILIGPVQTGRNAAFPYESIPEYTWSSLWNICRYLLFLLDGKETELSGDESSYAETYAASKMYDEDSYGGELKSFDDLFLCVMTGDMKNLERLMLSEGFLTYLDRVMPDMHRARTVFQFNLAKTYHSAQQSQASIDDLVPLVDLYLSESTHYQSPAAYKSGVQRMLYDFTRYIRQYKDERYSPLINRAIMYIRDNIYTQITTEDIASHCMVSISTLQHRFKEETGMTAKEKIRTSKIERACFLLRNTDLTCSDIAYRMGYGSQSYFLKQFRKTKGITPTEYRASC